MGFWDSVVEILRSDIYRGVILLAGVVVAIVSVLTARILARRKQTIDALIASRTDQRLDDGFACFAQHYDKDDANMRSFAKRENWGKEETEKMKFVLNHWEYVAIGIRMGIYDDDMFRIASRSSVVTLWDRSKEFVQALRKESQRNYLFIEFEKLVERWNGRPLKAPPTGIRKWLTYIGVVRV